MDGKSTDRRVRKTKAALRNAVIQLLAERKLNEIPVKELCELADVNRGTFYLHYRDVYDLYDNIQQEIKDEVMKSIFSSSKGNVGDPTVLFDIFKNLLYYLENNRDACVAILGPNRSDEFFDGILEIPKQSCTRCWSELYGVADTNELEMMYFYVVSGCLGLIKTWVQEGQADTPDNMAARLERFIMRGLSALEYYN